MYKAIIKNWQIHHLDFPQDQVDKSFPELKGKKPTVFTGTVVDCPSGQWQPGDHMRSTVILKIDRDLGVIKTLNSLYKMGVEGDDIFPDLGNGVLKIFY